MNQINFKNMEKGICKNAKSLLNATVWVCSTENSRLGAWLNLRDYSCEDDVLKDCDSIFGDGEYKFVKWENIPNALIGREYISETYFKLIDSMINGNLYSRDEEAILIWCNEKGSDLHGEYLEEIEVEFDDEYRGKYKSKEDFASEFAIENCCMNRFNRRYFDLKKLSDELFDSRDSRYRYFDGHVFYKGQK